MKTTTIRISSGELIGRMIKSPKINYEPTKSIVRQALFNIINSHGWQKDSFLDLYAGSGSVGIEAYSNDFKTVCFVEINNDACSSINESISELKINGNVICSKVEDYISKNSLKYDIIYADPPYNLEYYNSFIDALKCKTDYDKDSIIIIEMFHKGIASETIGNYKLFLEKRYGITKLCFYKS